MLINSTRRKLLFAGMACGVAGPVSSAPTFDLSGNTVEGQTIAIGQLFGTNSPTIVEGKEFRNCQFVGPGNLLLYGRVNADIIKFIDCDLVRIRVPTTVNTAVVFRSVTFLNCTFRKILIMMEEAASRAIPGEQFITESCASPT